MKKIVLLLTVLTAVLFAGDFEDGVKAYNNKDYKTAVALYQKVADQGNVWAQTNLGVMYAMGRGVKKIKLKPINGG